MLRGDYLSAFLDLVGVIPAIGEVGDAIKSGKKGLDYFDGVADTAGTITKTTDKLNDATDAGNMFDDVFKTGNAFDNTSAVSGARITDPHSKEADRFAKSYYEEIRHYSTDTKKISENIGVDIREVEEIKNYLFVNNSKYDDELGEWVQFDPDCAIAHSWQRLMNGNDIKPHDRTLVLHELYEMELKAKNSGISHLEAHSLASKKYNYGKEAEEYYGSLKKHNKE